MTTDMKKQLLGILRILLPASGFVMTCSGAYLLSLHTDDEYHASTVLIYILIILGFVAIVFGVLWTVCHSMKSKTLYRRRPERHIQVFTVERPSCYPPSYEESERSLVSSDITSEFVVRVDGVDMVMSVAPPLYSQDDLEPPDCTFSWEQPPRYSVVEGIQRGQAEEH